MSLELRKGVKEKSLESDKDVVDVFLTYSTLWITIESTLLRLEEIDNFWHIEPKGNFCLTMYTPVV